MGPGPADAERIRLWFRLPPGRRFRLRVETAQSGGTQQHVVHPLPAPPADSDHTVALDWPQDFDGAEELRSGAEHRFELQAVQRGSEVGIPVMAFRRETPAAPGVDGRAKFAFLSCHQPFRSDGSPHPESLDMLQRVLELLREERPDAVFLMGDQLYSDMPRDSSEFDSSDRLRLGDDATAADVRQRWHTRYRRFWDVPGWREMLAEFSCLPILDDHEVKDCFGSSEEHRTEDWAPIRHGALQAYTDYQASRVLSAPDPTGPFHFPVERGPVRAFVLDLRSQRLRDPSHPLLGSRQARDLERFLSDSEGAPHVLLVCSVPIAHVPRGLVGRVGRWIDGANEFDDRWESEQFRCDQDHVLGLLDRLQDRSPETRVLVAAGDIHVGSLQRIRRTDSGHEFLQIISSPFSHRQSALARGIARLAFLPHAMFDPSDGPRVDVELVRGEGIHRNPTADLNFAMVDFEGSAPDGRRLRLWSHRGDALELAFDVRA